MTSLTIADLSTAAIDGNGVFDVLMRATKAHLEQEFKLGRIKGPEYSEVYLGSLNQVLQTGLAFLLQKDEASLKRDLLAKQIELAGVEVQKAQVELEIAQANRLKVPEEVLQIKAQTALLGQQKINLASENLGIQARTLLTTQQKENAVQEKLVLVAQECKLKAEFDYTRANTQKSQEEQNLLAQRVATERAQVTALGVDENSVLGRQKLLYKAQTDGFTRDAEQKAAKLLVDTWSVRRTTDEGTVADGTNMLNDATVGRVITKLLVGVGA